MKTNYINFINRLMKTTNLPIEQMISFEEWIENRKTQFIEQSDENELNRGFEYWLNQRY